jgi:hypothetical protein
MFKYDETNTVILKSKECVESNEVNSCIIKINNFNNFYNPSARTIGISVNDNALGYVINNHKGDLESAIMDLYPVSQRNSLRDEFTSDKIKGSIHHELAHWIDDTKHNQHIKKRVMKASELGMRDLGGIPVNSTKMEIQGQIHNVKQLYNKYKDIWDTITFDELKQYSPTISSVYNQLKGEFRVKWLRDLKTRMAREGLLGKKMY